jgi:hypothetical protein
MTSYFSDCESDNDNDCHYHDEDVWTYTVKLGSNVFLGGWRKTTKSDNLLTIERDGEGVVYSMLLPIGTTVQYYWCDPPSELSMHVDIIREFDTLRVKITGSPNGAYDCDELIPPFSAGRFQTPEQASTAHAGSRRRRHRRYLRRDHRKL